VFRLPVTPAATVVERTTVRDLEHFQAAMATGRGVLFALPHTGNWDAAGAWLVAQGHPFTTVAERLRPESLYDRFVAFRESLGMEVLPLTGGPRPPYDVLVERLEAGRALCLLSDRDLSARGIDVTFFGAATRMPAGPASLALRTGAVVVPVTLGYAPGRWLVRFHRPVAHTDVATMTQDLADAFAAGIAEHPADWHMLQRLWLDDLAPDDPRRARQGGS
jgi:KDO2-lipid IV(A) lauroyltransferase